MKFVGTFSELRKNSGYFSEALVYCLWPSLLWVTVYMVGGPLTCQVQASASYCLSSVGYCGS